MRLFHILAVSSLALVLGLVVSSADAAQKGKKTKQGKAHSVHGVVTSVDTGAGTVTIKHAAIPNLQMEAMTMAFKAHNPSMLKDLKEGDEINFMADKIDGQLTVTDIDKR